MTDPIDHWLAGVTAPPRARPARDPLLRAKALMFLAASALATLDPWWARLPGLGTLSLLGATGVVSQLRREQARQHAWFGGRYHLLMALRAALANGTDPGDWSTAVIEQEVTDVLRIMGAETVYLAPRTDEP